MILAIMLNKGVHILACVLLLPSVSLITSQTLMPAMFRSQERDSADKAEERPLTKEQAAELAERLRHLVNGKAVVKNQCQVQGQQVQVEESSRIAEINGCKVVLVTAKTIGFATGPRQVEFTLSANLADLTTPASVQTQTFAQCRPIDGAVVKVMSRAAPGKTVHVSRRENKVEAKTDSLRGDLSFFFPSPDAAERAAQIVDRLVKNCGGQEWPDDDDLP